MAERRSPHVVVTVPCPACGAENEPDPTCTRCAGGGVLLLRVEPEHAALREEDLLVLYAGQHRTPSS
jgi:hypothetical protein